MMFSIRGARVLALTASLISAEIASGQSTQQPPRRPTPKPGQTSPLGATHPTQPAKRPSPIGTTTKPTTSAAKPAPSAESEGKKTPPRPTESATAKANSPNVRTALEYQPIQADIEIDQPTAAEIDKCTVVIAENLAQGSGWTVRDPAGQIIRNFIDTNGDKYVDQWCYYKDGVEVYRDVDTDFNGKADQYRWLNAAGSRWGIDRDEDGQIDGWKMISAEEVTAEVVAAIRDRDLRRFQRLLLTADELDRLGVGKELAEDLNKRIEGASKRFREQLSSQSAVGPDTKWLYFGGSRPGAVPAGTGRSASDLLVYENVAAMIETAGKPGQIMIGALVRVGDAWRLVDAPTEGGAETAVFFHAGQGQKVATTSNPGDPSAEERKLLDKIAELEAQVASAAPQEQGRLVARQVSLLEELVKVASTAQIRTQAQRQMIDTLAANAQSGSYPEGAQRLREIANSLADQPENAELAAHAAYSAMLSDYTQSIGAPNAPYEKIQKQWVEDLQSYVKKYPKSPELSEALMQLAQTLELMGDDAGAIKWYGELAMRGGDSPQEKKAEGARRRLDSVGKSIPLAGKDVTGRKVDLADPAYRGKLVLIHYWESKSKDGGKRDIPLLKEMMEKYSANGFAIIGVSVDASADELRGYLAKNRVPWPQLYEDGGLDNRFATEMGIITLPTMILIDKQGKVLARDIHAEELDNQLEEALKPRVANKNTK